MKTYYARIPKTGWCVRVPRWLYNRWPWCGIVEMQNDPSVAVGRERPSVEA